MMATCAPRLPQRNWPHVFDVALNNMTGWTQVNDLLWTVTLSVVQRIHNVCGAVGEIGVHHGAYYTVLAATAQPSEPLWACDVFEEGFRSGYNVDRSGRGSKTRLLENVRRALDGSADSEREIVLSPFTSLRLHDAETAKIVDDRVGRFRLLSVDGGHSEVVAFSDLRWTASRILPGGVIALDDVLVSGWPGVSRAVRAFYHMLDRRHERLRPLLLTEKKLFMVTPAVHAVRAPPAPRLAHRLSSSPTVSPSGREALPLCGRHAPRHASPRLAAALPAQPVRLGRQHQERHAHLRAERSASAALPAPPRARVGQAHDDPRHPAR